MTTLRSVCLATSLVDPRRKPEERFTYVDVSSVSNKQWAITAASDLEGAAAPSRARKALKSGDVIFATVRPTLRRVALVPPKLDGAVGSTAFCVVRADPRLADAQYLYFLLLSESFAEQVASLQRGASYPAITDGDVLEQSVLLPPLEEQGEIAEALSRIKGAVDNERQRVVLLRELKAATLAKLFREGLRGEPLKQTEIGEIPESWEVVRLGDLLEVAQYGLSLRGGSAGSIPILRMNCQKDGRVVLEDLQYVDLDEETFASFRLKAGDLLFNRTNSHELVGRTALFEGQVEAVFASYLIRLRVNEQRVVPGFVNEYLSLDTTQAAIRKLATRGVSQSNISAAKLRDWSVPIPRLHEQVRIADAGRALGEPLLRAERSVSAMHASFLAMLSLLMTGMAKGSD